LVGHYIAAMQAIVHVNGLGFASNNRDWIDEGSEAQRDAVGRLSNQQFGVNYSAMLDAFGNGDEPNEIASILAPAATARALRFANCEGRAALAYVYLAKMGIRPLEMMSVGDDHTFLVLGRNAGAIGDHASWNNDAVICDPWAEAAYKAPALATRLSQEPLKSVVGDPPVRIIQVCDFGGVWPPPALARLCTGFGVS
jgi:hypothetical protein